MTDSKSGPGDIAEVVRKRKRTVELTSIPFFVLAAIAILARLTSGRFLGIPFSVAGPATMVVFLLTLAFHVGIWRCPVCGGYLGLVGPSKFCPKCGVGLGEDSTPKGGSAGGPDRTGNPGSGFKF